jgi:Toprim-like
MRLPQAKVLIWYLKVRLLPGVPFRCIDCRRFLTEPGKCPHCKQDNRYRQVNGGNPGLFGCDTLPGHDVAVFCEGEFDVMLLDQEAGDLAGTVTLGSASGRLDLEWVHYLLPVSRFLLAYDADQAGDKGAEALESISARMRHARVPKLNPRDKDVTDYYKAGGNLHDWVKFLISQCEE